MGGFSAAPFDAPEYRQLLSPLPRVWPCVVRRVPKGVPQNTLCALQSFFVLLCGYLWGVKGEWLGLSLKHMVLDNVR